MILHGVTANALGFGGVGRALAGDGWTVDALDLPGHGGTRWTDRTGQPLADQESIDPSAYDLRHVGELVAAAMAAIESPFAEGVGPPVLLGHSWGAGVAVMAIDAGARVASLVLVDPPFLTPQQGARMADGFHAELQPSLEDARALVRSWGWPDEDVEAKARALVETSPRAAEAISRGAPWDPIRLMSEWRTRHPDVRVDIIAGNPAAGGLVPGPILVMLRVAMGAERLHEIPDAGHSPHRETPEQFIATLRAILG